MNQRITTLKPSRHGSRTKLELAMKPQHPRIVLTLSSQNGMEARLITPAEARRLASALMAYAVDVEHLKSGE